MQPVTTASKPAHNAVDMTGHRVGMLTVLGRSPSDGRYARWDCRCDCGRLTNVAGYALRSAAPIQSCGCLRAAAGLARRLPEQERFWPKVRKSSGCWEWTASRDAEGYGLFRLTNIRRLRRAHIVSWETLNGPVPSGMEVCHSCDNPPCVRPDHLFIGTHAENRIDCARKFRMHNQKLRPEDVVRIRSSELSRNELAAMFGVLPKTISSVRLRRTWRHIP